MRVPPSTLDSMTGRGLAQPARTPTQSLPRYGHAVPKRPRSTNAATPWNLAPLSAAQSEVTVAAGAPYCERRPSPLYGNVDDALADLDSLDQMHKDDPIGKFDAAVIDMENGKPHIVKRLELREAVNS
ncbi:MAG: hypothetical protein ACLP0L_11120 [Solirubrobacteraceae bacterium]